MFLKLKIYFTREKVENLTLKTSTRASTSPNKGETILPRPIDLTVGIQVS